MNTRKPLTAPERTMILDQHTAGASLEAIRLTLYKHGFVRGKNTISTFLESRGRIPNGHRRASAIPLHHRRCEFCNWHGPHPNYYDHWRTTHRTRAGTQRIDLRNQRYA